MHYNTLQLELEVHSEIIYASSGDLHSIRKAIFRPLLPCALAYIYSNQVLATSGDQVEYRVSCRGRPGPQQAADLPVLRQHRPTL